MNADEHGAAKPQPQERDCAESQSQLGGNPTRCGWSSIQPRSKSLSFVREVA
jgi:hypothetical protein